MAVLHPNPSALEALGVVPTPKSSIRLRPKEIANASKDGFTVVVRPRPEGGFHVLTVNVETQTQVGWPLIAESRSDVPQAITELMRDMSKFMGVGDNMAQSGRHRDKRSIARVASQWMSILERGKTAASEIEPQDLEQHSKEILQVLSRSGLRLEIAFDGIHGQILTFKPGVLKILALEWLTKNTRVRWISFEYDDAARLGLKDVGGSDSGEWRFDRSDFDALMSFLETQKSLRLRETFSVGC